MQSKFSELFGSATSFLTGHKPRKELELGIIDARRAGAHAVLSDDDIEEVSESNTKAGNKRNRRVSQRDMSPPQIKRRRVSSHGGIPLEPDYDVGKDAVPVHVPQAFDSDVPKATISQRPSPLAATKMPHKVGGGSLRITNTLGNQRPGRARPTGQAARQPPDRGPSTLTQAAATSRGSSATGGLRGEVDNGFGDSERPHKRSRTLYAVVPRTQVEPINVDDSDDSHLTGHQESVRVISNGRRASHNSQQSHVTIEDSQPTCTSDGRFKPTESMGLDHLIQTKQRKKRRLERHGSNRGSAQPSPSQEPDVLRDDRRDGSSSQPLCVEGDDSPPLRPTNKSVQDPGSTPKLPRIDLDRGVGEYVQEKTRNFHTGLINGVTKGRPTTRYAIEHPQAATSATPSGGPRRSAVPISDSNQDTRRVFNRDHATPDTQQQRVKRKDAMQMNSSRQSEVQERPGSPDELANLPITRRKNASPAQQPPTANLDNSRQRSESKFHFPISADPRAPVDNTTAESATGQSTSFTHEEPIPIDAIYSRGCLLEEGLIRLVWIHEKKRFEIHHDGQRQMISGQNDPVEIGSNEARVWIQSKKSLAVQIKGSGTASTKGSNGQMIIQFSTQQGKEDCFDLLSVYGCTFKEHDELTMDKIFNTQAPALVKEYQRCTELAEKPLNQATLPRELESVRHLPDDDIVYENETGADVDVRRVPARTRMQGSDRNGSETSPYFASQGARKSTRQPKPTKPRSPSPPPPERWTEMNNIERWKQSVLFPPQGARRITVDFEDLERLDEGEFLNDNIVGFALRRTEEDMPPEHREKVHFFNSFFYTSLSMKNGKKGFNYEAVQKWTKQKDIFETPYVVVPINDNLHWYLAIICNLQNLQRQTQLTEDELEPTSSIAKSLPSVAQAPADRSSIVPDSQEDCKPAQTEPPSLNELSLIDVASEPSIEKGDTCDFDDQGNALTDDDVQEHTANAGPKRTLSNGKKKGKRPPPPLKKIDLRQPVIITLDSFGSAHNPEVAKLKDYISAEGKNKRGMAVSRDQITGLTAKGIPQQTNFCDCGLYLVGYVQEFAKDPQTFIKKVLSRELDLDEDFADFDPSRKRDEIRDDLLKLYDKQNEERQIAKAQKRLEKDAAATRLAKPVDASANVVAVKPSSVPKSSPPESRGKGFSPERRAQPTALWAPRDDVSDATFSVATEKHPRPPSIPRTSAQHGEAEDDALDSGPARALTDITSARLAAQSEKSSSRPELRSRASSGHDEMLDNAADIGELARYGAASPRHKTDASHFDEPLSFFRQGESPITHRSPRGAVPSAGVQS